MEAIAVTAVAFIACKNKDESAETTVDAPEEEPAEVPASDPMDGASYKRVPSTQVEVPIPPGWVTSKRSLYSVATSPDDKAFIAFTTVSSRGEFVGRIQHVVKTFKVTDYVKGKVTDTPIGPDGLKANIVDATCNFHDVPAHMSSVLVNYGKRRHVFVVYALDKSASKETTVQAQQAVLRMRRTR